MVSAWLAVISGGASASCAILSVWTGDARWFGTAMVLMMVGIVASAVATFPRD